MPYNYKMTIAYDGTKYCGWQVQPNGLSIQEIIQTQLKTILRTDVCVIGSGRTDTGVHASGQIANFQVLTLLDPMRLRGSLNGLLPPDIRIKEVSQVPLAFHAQYSAINKTYHYHLHLDPVPDPFKRLYSLHVRHKLNLGLLQEAISLFIGTKDFSAFANENHKGSAAKDAVRTLYRLEAVEELGGLRLEFEADGFLYRMVRNITGTLLEIAIGKRSLSDVPMMFASKDRRLSGQAAAPQGLFLVKVGYPKELLTMEYDELLVK